MLQIVKKLVSFGGPDLHPGIRRAYRLQVQRLAVEDDVEGTPSADEYLRDLRQANHFRSFLIG